MLRKYCSKFVMLAAVGATALSCGNDADPPDGSAASANGAAGGAGGRGGASGSSGKAGSAGSAGTSTAGTTATGGSGGGSAGKGGAPSAGSSNGGGSGGSVGGTSGGTSTGGSSGTGVGGVAGDTSSGGSSSGGVATGGTAGQSGGTAGDAAGGAPNGGVGGSASGASGAGGKGGSSGASGASGKGGSGGSGGGTSPFPPGVTRPRIMIVGDSISAGPGCYKKALLQNLTTNGYSSFEFVGPYNDDCGGGVKHAAVSCSTAEQYTSATFMMSNCSQGMSFAGMSTLATNNTPNLIMLQLGVNDVWGGKSTSQILGFYTTLVQQARAQNPNIVLVVAQIQKIRPDCTNDTVAAAAQTLVAAVPAWAQGLNTAQSPVFTADLNTNSNSSMAETSDCIHPNDAGAVKMGLNWYNALKNILPK